MAASNTDKLRKGFYGAATALAGSIGNTDTTIPFNSTAGWPTDTAIDVTVDRVDASGNKTPSKQETITVVVSGNNGITAVRGVEGSAQAHSSGAVVEITYTAKTHNDQIDAILQDHDQQGRAKQLTDTNGNKALGLTPTASAVNYPNITNAATGGSPELNAAGSDPNINLLLDGQGTGLVISRSAMPEGQLTNGQIVASVASSNLTVAIKTLQGNNPSSADPVYVRIGNTVRSLKQALSLTLNAGTNWFGKGSSYFGANESDFFVYLVWNTNQAAIQLAISSDPSMRVYSDFSTTNTAWNYFAGSAGLAPTSTDTVENIGRFNAILGVVSSFLWSIPATVVIVNRPTYETRVFSFTNTGTAGGTFYYRQRGAEKRVWGVTNTFTITASGDASNQLIIISPFFSAVQSAAATTYGNGNGAYDTWVNSVIRNMATNAATIGMHNFGSGTSGNMSTYIEIIGS